jgi:hypothetical protein
MIMHHDEHNNQEVCWNQQFSNFVPANWFDPIFSSVRHHLSLLSAMQISRVADHTAETSRLTMFKLTPSYLMISDIATLTQLASTLKAKSWRQSSPSCVDIRLIAVNQSLIMQ